MQKVTFKYNYGDQVKDQVTGFKGIVMAQTHYINGCIRYSVQPSMGKDLEKLPDQYYFDEAQLVLVKAASVKVKEAPTGGPRQAIRSNRL